MIPYILHTSLLLAGSFILYYILLRKETFYKANRLFLMGTIALSLIIPAIHIPASFSIHEPKVIEQSSSTIEDPAAPIVNKNTNVEALSSTDVSEPTITENNSPIAKANKWYEGLLPNWNVSKWLWIAYLLGIFVFSLSFLIQFSILLIKKSKLQYMQDGAFKIYELTDDTAPFSFLKWIFINPSLYDNETFNQILEHEKIHVSQMHYLDKIIVELALIVFWFNPFVWMYRKIVSNNLEFLTDEAMLNKGTEKEHYQMSLLKVSVPQHALDLTTNYNESFLSERIKMMSLKKSSARSSWKYLLILPLLALSISTFNAVSPIVQILDDSIPQSNINEDTESMNSLTASPSETNVKQEYSSESKFESKRETTNSQGKQNDLDSIKIKNKRLSNIEVDIDKSDDYKKSLKSKVDKSITKVNNSRTESGHKITFKQEHKDNKISGYDKQACGSKGDEHSPDDLNPGAYKGKVKGDDACFVLNNSKTKTEWSWTMTQCFAVSEISNFSIGKDLLYNVARDPGTLNFDGDLLEERYGYGVFEFEESEVFANFLKGVGLPNVTKDQLFQMFLNDTDMDWVKEYKNYGFEFSMKGIVNSGIHQVDKQKMKDFNDIFRMIDDEDKSYKKIVNMAIHGVTKDLAESLYELDNSLTITNIVSAKIHGVTPEYIDAVQSAGFDEVSITEVISMNIHGVSIGDIKNYRKAGFDSDSPKGLINLSIHGMEPAMHDDYASLGLKNLSEDDLTAFGIHGVDKGFVKSIKESGLRNYNSDDMVSFAIHGVNGKYVERFVNLGYKNISADNLIECAIHGVRPKDVERMHKMGFMELSIRNLVDFEIHGVDSQYYSDLTKSGLKDLSPRDLINGRIHGLQASYVNDIKDLGVKGISFDKLEEAMIHNVSVNFIKKARKKGYNPKYLEDYIELSIHGF